MKFFASAIFLFMGMAACAQKSVWPVTLEGKDFQADINPATGALRIKTANGGEAYASRPQQKSEVKDLVVSSKTASWKYPDQGIKTTMAIKDGYLDVEIMADRVSHFAWPSISDDVVAYTIPWHDGKYIPAHDSTWIRFCRMSGDMTGLEDLSMQFLGINYRDFSLVFIIKNMFNNELQWNTTNSLGLRFTHEFPATVKTKNYGFRIYVRKNDPVAIAKTYKDYVVSEGKFVTLEQKAEKNPNIRKLYGAPFIYLFGNGLITKESIKDWKSFLEFFIRQATDSRPTVAERILALNKNTEAYSELEKACKEYHNPDGPSAYLKNLFTGAFNQAMESRSFYLAGLWETAEMDPSAKAYIEKGVSGLSDVELFDLNQKLFYQAYKGHLQPVSEWGNGVSLFVLNKLQEMGVKKAWLGLEAFEPAYRHPWVIAEANRLGYLIGPYDSYHSIHMPGKEQWETAKFTDTTLYYTATVVNKDGDFNKGFQGVGRKLNPTLSLPAVKDRVNDILDNGFAFNSWFIDCDATGEVFDDYAKNHTTSQAEDVAARLERMAWIRDAKHMVIGSEGGNDFAATTIAFGHGLCSPGFPWNDLDWRKNKASKYYFGPYYSPDAGAPLNATKQVPIKELYHYIFYDCRFNLPLFQLVYNNSVIVSHHWGLGSLKIISEVKNNKLREILYNFPPLYNLDRSEIVKHEKTIADHIRIFSKTHVRAIRSEMTDFGYLTQDKMVQRTRFASELEVVANFGDKPYKYKQENIPAMSLLVIYPDENKREIYTPIQ